MRDLTSFEIIDLDPDQKISTPGFYRLGLDRHHNQPCDGFSVTSSSLRTIDLGSPADFWAFHVTNPNRYEQPETKPMRLGRAMHCLVEGGPSLLEDEFRVLVGNRPNRPTLDQKQMYRRGLASPAATKSVEYWMEVDADPRSIITEEEWDKLIQMGKVMANDPGACAALGGEPELTMAWQDDITGIWCLARPDNLQISGGLSDFKMMSPQGKFIKSWMIDKKIDDFRYDMQMAFGAEGFQELTGTWPDSVGLVFQSDKPPYHVILRGIDDEDLSIAKFDNRQALNRIAECLESQHWPGPGEVVENYRRRDEDRKRKIEEMQIAGVAP